METWDDLSATFRSDAYSAMERDSYRTTLNRAYYSVYARTAQLAADVGLTFAKGREGPTHGHIYHGALVANHMGWLGPKDQGAVISLCDKLYRLRCIADYRPSDVVDGTVARQALRDMREALEMLRREKA